MLYLKQANKEDIEKEWLFQRSIPADENGFINDYPDISKIGTPSTLASSTSTSPALSNVTL